MGKLIQKMALPVVTMSWAIWYLSSTYAKNERAVLLIRPVVYIMLVLFVLNSVREYKKWKKEMNSGESSTEYASVREIKIAFICFGLVAIYILSMDFLGFIISTLIFLIGSFIALKAKPVPSIIVGISMTTILYVVFKVLLKMPVPRGFLGF